MKITLDRQSKQPIYLQILQSVSESIRRGELGPGGRLPTETELAESLGVNRMTISRGYSLLESKGIINQRRGQGSFVSPDAGKMLGVSHRRFLRTVGFVFGATNFEDIPHNYKFLVFDAMTGVSLRFQQTHVNLAHLPIGNVPGALPDAVKNRISEYDAFLLMGNTKVLEPFVELTRQYSIPNVRLSESSPWPDVPSVTYDRRHAMRLAVDHLVRCGHRTIGYIGLDDRSTNGHNSKRGGFFEALEAHGLEARPEYFVHASTALGEVYRAMGRFGDRANLPDAFVADTDVKAMEAICALETRGIIVPRDVSIIGYDDIADAATFTPALTTVRVRRKQIGWHGADLLFQWAADGPIPPGMMLNSELVVRASVADKAAAPRHTQAHVQVSVSDHSGK